MKHAIKKIILFGDKERKDVTDLMGQIEDSLTQQHIQVVCVDSYQESDAMQLAESIQPDLIITLGGDGTVLAASRFLGQLGTPMLAINLGTFGFLTEITKEEWKETFLAYQRGDVSVSRRLMLRVSVTRKGKEVVRKLALNDAVIRSSGISHVVNLEPKINGVSLGTLRADGVLVATPTGSTAYNLASGGPIVEAGMEALVLNPISPFSLSPRPLVVSGDDIITVEVAKTQRTDLVLSLDGQDMIPLELGDLVTIERSLNRTLLVESLNRSYYDVVCRKFNWSGGGRL